MMELFAGAAAEGEDAGFDMGNVNLDDPATWTSALRSKFGCEILKTQLKQHAGLTGVSTKKRTLCVSAVLHWMSAANALDGFEEVEPFVALGDTLMTMLRLILAEEVRKIEPEDVLRQVVKDNGSDQLAQAIEKLASQQKKKPSWNKNSKFFCTFCHTRGHTDDFCRKKKQEGESSKPTGKNAKGSGH
jgi:hypothetical protein